MKKFIYIAFFFGIACSKEQANDCFTSLGEDGSRMVNIDRFDKLNVTDRIVVELIDDSTRWGEAEIDGPSNLLEQIHLDIEGDELFITNSNTCNFVRSYDYEIVVRLYVHQLAEIRLNSVARVFSKDTITGNGLRIYHEALSDLDLTLNYSNEVYVRTISSAKTILRGKARALSGSIEEISDLDARDLLCEDVLIDSHTKYPCYVNGSRILYIKIFNSGNVYYVQEPSLYKDLNLRRGTGDLIKL